MAGSDVIKLASRLPAGNFPSQGGGKAVITRILQAYGFTTRQALCDHLGVSQSTMANRWMRDTFPHDWLLACHLDTGAALIWLATGEGEPRIAATDDRDLRLPFREICNGVYGPTEDVRYDARLVPDGISAPCLVKFENAVYLVDTSRRDINDGLWLIEIDHFTSIRQIYRLPGDRLRVENGPASFECRVDEIKVNGRVISCTEYKD